MRVLALDVGSSSTRAGAYDERGRAASEPARRSYASHDGLLDADELRQAAEAVLAEAGDADALGISCFWHSLLLLDEHDRPLTPVLLWQDRRATPQAEALAERLDAREVQARTGCTFHPSFWPAKLEWLRSEGVLSRARRARRSPPLPARGCSISVSGAGTWSCSTSWASTKNCCRRSRTSRSGRRIRRSATARARISAPVASRPTAPR